MFKFFTAVNNNRDIINNINETWISSRIRMFLLKLSFLLLLNFTMFPPDVQASVELWKP